MEMLNPADFGFSSRTVLKFIKKNQVAFVINRKSRIVMKDGYDIAEKADVVRKSMPSAALIVMTDAPVCSKTERFLADKGINIISMTD